MGLILLLGLILRLTNLLTGKSWWGDEAFSMTLAKKPFFEIIQGAIQDVHPPLYYMVLHLFSQNEASMLAFSAICGVGVVFGVYLLGKTIFCKKTGIIAALLTAISPYYLQSSNEIRSYSFFAFLTVLSTYFYFKK